MKENKIHKLLQRVLLLMAFCTLSFTVVNAQSTVSGVIKDSDGEPVVGANVIIDGTTTGTTTDFDGNYTIQVPSDDAVLVFSMMGMATEKARAGDVTDAPMVLLPDLVGLDEVVVVGYGTMKKNDITGSVSSIGSEDILSAPIVSLDQGLQGKMAGVTLQQTTGAPGGAMKMRIRGSSSINYSNEPLYVIDGFVGGDMTSVNPGDIERIDILKDASATAIYGSRGANGVVLITTKSAKPGEFKISLDATWGVSNQVKDIEVLDKLTTAELFNETQVDVNKPAYITDEQMAEIASTPTYYPFDYITRQAFTQNYNLSMAGGDEKITYMFSAGYIDEEGVVNNSFRKKYSLRSNIKADIKPWLDIKFNTYGTHDNSMGNETNNRSIYDSYFHNTIWDLYNPDGSYQRPGEPWGPYRELDMLRPNPIEYNEILAQGEKLNEGVTSNIDFNFKITEDLTFTTTGSGRYSMTYSGNMKTPDGQFIKTEKDMSADGRYDRNRSLMNTNILKYHKKIGLHDFTATAVHEYSNQQYRRLEATVTQLATKENKWYVLENGVPNTTRSYYWQKEILSFMGRLNYSYADKYLFTASLRNDKTSVFQPGNQADNFWAFAGGWVISNENFLSSYEWIENLKLRVGWGQTGNMAIGAYQTLNGLQSPYGYGYWGYYTFDGTEDGIVGGPTQKTIYTDENLRWETQEQTNVGVDFSILGGKLNFTADYYLKQSKDVILNQTLAEYTGYKTYTSNFGQINNSGFEFMTDWNAIETTDFRVNVGANISVNRNEVVDLGEDAYGNPLQTIVVDETDLGNRLNLWSYAGENMFLVERGKSLGQIYGLRSLGLVQLDEVDPASETNDFGNYAGEHKYYDKPDADGNTNGVIDGDDREVIGNSQADFTYGINLNITYKMFNLAVNGVGSYGNDIYNYNRHFMDMNYSNPDYLNRWSPTNTGSTQQRSQIGPSGWDKYLLSQYVEDGSYFKVKNVTLTCNLPDNWLSYARLNSFSLFMSVNNLLTITNYTGVDPEASSTGNSSEAMSGLDAWAYPLARTYTFGLKTNF